MCPIAAQSSVRSDLQIVVNFLKMQDMYAGSVGNLCSAAREIQYICMWFHHAGERRSMTCPLIEWQDINLLKSHSISGEISYESWKLIALGPWSK